MSLCANKPTFVNKPMTRVFFRVQADKLEALNNIVGELAIRGSAAKRPARASGDAVVLETAHQMSSLVEDIRHSSLTLRRVIIGESFTCYRRVVRDLAAKLSKALRVKIAGGDTAVEQPVVEKIGDPLLDLFRNEHAHCSNWASERQSAGEPADPCHARPPD